MYTYGLGALERYVISGYKVLWSVFIKLFRGCPKHWKVFMEKYSKASVLFNNTFNNNNTFIYKALVLAKPRVLYKRYINNI